MACDPPGGIAALAPAMRACRICVARPRGAPLPHEPRPIFQVAPGVRLVVASQALLRQDGCGRGSMRGAGRRK